jgi:hypothetical protein
LVAQRKSYRDTRESRPVKEEVRRDAVMMKPFDSYWMKPTMLMDGAESINNSAGR